MISALDSTIFSVFRSGKTENLKVYDQTTGHSSPQGRLYLHRELNSFDKFSGYVD
jgi:hypothetical protein